MSAADWLSNGIATAAFLFSVASFYVSWKGERPRLKITCHTYLEHEGYGPPRILVRVVNVGRRPVILRIYGGYDTKKESGGSFFDYEKGGVRIEEHEAHEFSYMPEDLVLQTPDDIIELERLYVEDSTGIRHSVPASKADVKALLDTLKSSGSSPAQTQT